MTKESLGLLIQGIHQESLPEDIYKKTTKAWCNISENGSPTKTPFFTLGKKIGHTYALIANCLSNAIGVDRAHYKQRAGLTKRRLAEKQLRDIQQKIVSQNQTEQRRQRGLNTNQLNDKSQEFIYDLMEFLHQEGIISIPQERVTYTYRKKISAVQSAFIKSTIHLYKQTPRGIKFLFSDISYDKNSNIKNSFGNLIDHALQYGYTYQDIAILANLTQEELAEKLYARAHMSKTATQLDLLDL